MKSKMLALAITAAMSVSAITANAAELPYRLKTTKSHTAIVDIDNSLPDNYWLVTFVVIGNKNSKINGKQWDGYAQQQIIDCDDLTYKVVGGVYTYNGDDVHSFHNEPTVSWREANSNDDNSLRVVEFCANTKIIGD